MRLGPLFGRVVLALGAVACIASPACAVRADHVDVSLVLNGVAKPGSVVWATVWQRIDPGWHTYWRNPGEAGLSTTIAWAVPQGVTPGSILWPAPERFSAGSIVSFGYRGNVGLLVPLHVSRHGVSGSKIGHATVDFLECAQMCIPEHVVLDLDLAKPTGSPDRLAAARASLPGRFRGIATVAVDRAALSLTLVGPDLRNARPDDLMFFPATAHVVDLQSRTSIHVARGQAVLTFARLTRSRPVGEFDGVLAIGHLGSFAVKAIPRPVSGGERTPVSFDRVGLWSAVVFAFLGGLILNLMPCVLPILSLKALGMARASEDAHSRRRDGGSYFAGVMATFGALGGALFALKLSGAAVGWGFQLQSPPVILALTLLMVASGLNMLGIFELPLSLAGIGDGLTRRKGSQGAFFTGALAVLVASPCTAPFMGSALGYALAAPALPALLVFVSLGVGFALPFTLLALLPGLVRVIPKPGPWTIRFRQFLAFPMLATAIWLTWVLATQTGPDGVAIVLSIGLILGFLAWLFPLLGRSWRIAIGVTGCLALLMLAAQVHTASLQDGDGGPWAPWSEAAVLQARAAGRPVLVDFSAAWCVTCLVNERFALQNATVSRELARRGVVTLRADWTTRNAKITGALERYGRGGVPLYLLYPARGDVAVLPQILTPALVLVALDRVVGAQTIGGMDVGSSRRRVER